MIVCSQGERKARVSVSMFPVFHGADTRSVSRTRSRPEPFGGRVGLFPADSPVTVAPGSALLDWDWSLAPIRPKNGQILPERWAESTTRKGIRGSARKINPVVTDSLLRIRP